MKLKNFKIKKIILSYFRNIFSSSFEKSTQKKDLKILFSRLDILKTRVHYTLIGLALAVEI